MNTNELLIVFAKNPVKGKVKTRLAKTLGEEKALNIYTMLLKHTNSVSSALDCDKVIYYSDFIPEDDHWKQSGFQQNLQQGNDLGERMLHAFNTSFHQGYQSVCIIGTDCFELSTSILENAFHELKNNQVVIGPASDGGYYLLGLTNNYEDIFQNKKWSTNTVLKDTIKSAQDNHLSLALLPELSDIDTEEDLKSSSLLISGHV